MTAMEDLYGYYDYTPQDAVVHYITETEKPVIHQYTRDGKYVGTITDRLIVTRATRNWRPEIFQAVRLFLVMVAECFPEKLHNAGLPNLPDWHPLIIDKEGKKGLIRIPVVSGPHMGSCYSSYEVLQWLMFEHDTKDVNDEAHLYRLELDPTVPCGYIHVLSGSKEEVNAYCVANDIRCIRGG